MGDRAVTKTILLLVSAAWLLAPAGPAAAQQAAKPVSRADFLKTLDTRFNAIDTNHDGKITRDEMVAAQQRDLQQARTKIAQQLEAKFKQLDTNKDGQLSLKEFMAAAPGINTTETPDQMMQKFDANHDGKITADEFRAPEIAQFNRLDANHDGVVTPQEMKAAAGRK
jgi:Ca2+-binding EF-hand superfamily protein